MRLGADGILTPPQARHSLLLSVELQARLAVESISSTAGNTLLVSSEGKHGERDRDGDIDANLSGLNVLLET